MEDEILFLQVSMKNPTCHTLIYTYVQYTFKPQPKPQPQGYQGADKC
jgi:hypothetical protein